MNVIPTGSLRLDYALGIGGISRGEITEIHGDISSGKTTLCQHLIAEANKLGGACVFIDADHSFIPQYAHQCGVVLEQVYLVEPDSAEQALETAYILARSGAFTAIVIDSLTRLVTRAELTAPLGGSIEAPIGELVARWLPRLMTAIQSKQTALIMTDQTTTGMSSVYHNLETHLSRMALPLSAAIRMKLNLRSPLDEYRSEHPIQVQIVKNKYSPCFKTVELDIIVNRGINKTDELIALGEELGILSRHGKHYYYQALDLGARREEIDQVLRQGPWIAAEINRAIRMKLNI